jgi:hypothetical protein
MSLTSQRRRIGGVHLAVALALGTASSLAVADDCYVEVPLAAGPKPAAKQATKPRPKVKSAGAAQAGVVKPQPRPRPRATTTKPKAKPVPPVAAPQMVRKRVECGPTEPRPADIIQAERPAATPFNSSKLVEAQTVPSGIGAGGTGGEAVSGLYLGLPGHSGPGVPSLVGMAGGFGMGGFGGGSFASSGSVASSGPAGAPGPAGPAGPTGPGVPPQPPAPPPTPPTPPPGPPHPPEPPPPSEVPLPGTLGLLLTGLVPLLWGRRK